MLHTMVFRIKLSINTVGWPHAMRSPVARNIKQSKSIIVACRQSTVEIIREHIKINKSVVIK